ncbi:MAG: hypothetical protein IPL23_30680 [Saprospiraceae bacterium]|nr:hypothetical protein [Saprospiraceae bacterium]
MYTPPGDLELPDVIPGFQIRLADFQLNYNSTQGFVTESMVTDGTGSAFAFGVDFLTGDVELGLGVFNMSLKAGFGNYGKPKNGPFGSERYYGWWYFDGMARLWPGLPLVPPFTIAHFNGFGGGIYWNATAPSVTISMEDIMENGDATTVPPPSDDKPEPRYGERTLAFRAKLEHLIADPGFYGRSFRFWYLG